MPGCRRRGRGPRPHRRARPCDAEPEVLEHPPQARGDPAADVVIGDDGVAVADAVPLKGPGEHASGRGGDGAPAPRSQRDRRPRRDGSHRGCGPLRRRGDRCRAAARGTSEDPPRGGRIDRNRPRSPRVSTDTMGDVMVMSMPAAAVVGRRSPMGSSPPLGPAARTLWYPSARHGPHGPGSALATATPIAPA